MGNTLDSHCLIEWAGTKGKQDEVVEELFKRYVRRAATCTSSAPS